MGRRRRLTVFTTLAVLAALLTPLSEARSGSTTTTFRLLSVLSGYAPKDVAPKGPSAGDSVLERDRLYNLVPQFGRAKGAFVGIDVGVATIEKGMQGARFRGIAKLPGGTIAVSGHIPLQSNRVELRVSGGTGQFAHARGTVVIRSNNSRRATNVFRLTLP